MTEEFIEEMGAWLAEVIDNTKTPAMYPSHNDFKRDWLYAVADVATKLAKEL